MKDVVLYSAKDRYRYARFKAGQSPEEIALQDKISIARVKASIRAVEIQNSLYGLDALEVSQSEIVMYNKERQKIAISEALVAEKKVYAEQGEFVGEVIATEPDHETRLQAVGELRQIVAALGVRHSKGPSQNINLNQSLTMNTGTLVTFEDRLREIKKRRDSGELASGETIDIQPSA